ncbi:hypothetical protein EXN66_Car021293 [Channa argus]|uniref:Secreted protein n=1 Tax=Channa argus TaxID=215402 RepID=A0A6G1QSM9_CHAAH|nr:hypothetical protein EXN66_Car021293 [Channa argus]
MWRWMSSVLILPPVFPPPALPQGYIGLRFSGRFPLLPCLEEGERRKARKTGLLLNPKSSTQTGDNVTVLISSTASNVRGAHKEVK